jgi:uncharacterized protein (DUF2141 family)|tara:strand:+ start:227 stop:646 length:420 start_codon:yes stop_codon:yes gene_type:complete
MKKIILITVMIFSAVFTTNAQEETFQITVFISGLDSNEGQVLIALHNEKAQFLKTAFKNAITKITNKKVMYTFKKIPVGEYAISVFHDKNSNNKMDVNFLGIPKEAYGCSNNTKGFMGPPKYEDAKFQLTKNSTIRIQI